MANLFERSCGVYIIECLPTGKIYVGQSRDVQTRAAQHIRSMTSPNKNTNKQMLYEWQEYGRNAFQCSIVELCDEKDLIRKEREWIRKFLPCDTYNMQKLKKRKYRVKYEIKGETSLNSYRWDIDDNLDQLNKLL